MLKLSYSTNGLTNLDFFTAISEVEKAKFDGVELSFQPEIFDPYTMTDEDLEKIKVFFSTKKVMPVAISTATTCFLSDVPHEPSLLSLNSSERQRRIDLIKRGVEIAKKIGVPTVSFQSGYLREEHVNNADVDPHARLVDGIKECLEDIGDITLVIEPEPGMFIETLDEAIQLIKKVNSDSFGLHMDICHAYCSEHDYVNSIANAVPHIKYIHLADIKEGYNLRLLHLETLDRSVVMDLDFAGYLINNRSNNVLIFINKQHCICLHLNELSSAAKGEVESFVQTLVPGRVLNYMAMDAQNPIACSVGIELENKAFLDSVGGIPLDILDNASLALKYLRNNSSNQAQAVIDKPVCNTIKGKVHYHETPGDGEIDFEAVLKALVDKQYPGYVTVELYNHSDVWESVLPNSREYLLKYL